jgi:hypothetical protein
LRAAAGRYVLTTLPGLKGEARGTRRTVVGFVVSHPSPEKRRRMGHPPIVVNERVGRPAGRYVLTTLLGLKGEGRGTRRTVVGFVVSHPSPEKRRRMGHPPIVVNERVDHPPSCRFQLTRRSKARPGAPDGRGWLLCYPTLRQRKGEGWGTLRLW